MMTRFFYLNDLFLICFNAEKSEIFSEMKKEIFLFLKLRTRLATVSFFTYASQTVVKLSTLFDY